jgi:group I intron endonuclease
MVLSGVYRIVNTRNENTYVGSSYNVQARMQVHRYELKKGTHPNPHLQRSWNKYGESAFVFSMIEEVPVPHLLERENYWIQYYHSFEREHGFNILRYAHSCLGYRWTEDQRRHLSEKRRGHVCSEITRKRIANSHIGKHREVKPVELRQRWSEIKKGKTKSESWKAKIGESQQGVKNHRFGKRWMSRYDHHPISVSPDEIDNLILQGWQLGRKKFS